MPRLLTFGGLVCVVVGCAGGPALASAPSFLDRFKALPPPAGWKALAPPSHTSVLWYPPLMKRTSGDPWSISVVVKGRNGTFLAYMNAGPKTGTEKMSNWASFRLDHLREERERAIHEEAHASGLRFVGGRGTCIIDDYVTRVAPNHYREIACLVQGHTAESVIVAAGLVNMWPTYGPKLERAVEVWQVA